MRFANRATSVGGLVLAVTCLAACGSSGTLLSAYQANELKGQLDQVSQSLNAHQCQQAANRITNFRSTVDGLGSVNQSLISNLDQGAGRIKHLLSKECPVQVVHHPKPKPPATTPATTATPTATTPTTPTQTATTPTTPTQTTTTPTTPLPPPAQTTTTPTPPPGPGSGGAGIGNGNGNGNGHGSGD